MTAEQLKHYRSMKLELNDTDTNSARKTALKVQTEEIERFVDSIEDTQLQRIFRLRYMTGKKKLSWYSIAVRTGYSSEHTPKRKHDNFLKKIL